MGTASNLASLLLPLALAWPAEAQPVPQQAALVTTYADGRVTAGSPDGPTARLTRDAA